MWLYFPAALPSRNKTFVFIWSSAVTPSLCFWWMFIYVFSSGYSSPLKDLEIYNKWTGLWVNITRIKWVGWAGTDLIIAGLGPSSKKSVTVNIEVQTTFPSTAEGNKQIYTLQATCWNLIVILIPTDYFFFLSKFRWQEALTRGGLWVSRGMCCSAWRSLVGMGDICRFPATGRSQILCSYLLVWLQRKVATGYHRWVY